MCRFRWNSQCTLQSVWNAWLCPKGTTDIAALNFIVPFNSYLDGDVRLLHARTRGKGGLANIRIAVFCVRRALAAGARALRTSDSRRYGGLSSQNSKAATPRAP